MLQNITKTSTITFTTLMVTTPNYPMKNKPPCLYVQKITCKLCSLIHQSVSQCDSDSYFHVSLPRSIFNIAVATRKKQFHSISLKKTQCFIVETLENRLNEPSESYFGSGS